MLFQKEYQHRTYVRSIAPRLLQNKTLWFYITFESEVFSVMIIGWHTVTQFYGRALSVLLHRFSLLHICEDQNPGNTFFFLHWKKFMICCNTWNIEITYSSWTCFKNMHYKCVFLTWPQYGGRTPGNWGSDKSHFVDDECQIFIFKTSSALSF